MQNFDFLNIKWSFTVNWRARYFRKLAKNYVHFFYFYRNSCSGEICGPRASHHIVPVVSAIVLLRYSYIYILVCWWTCILSVRLFITWYMYIITGWLSKDTINITDKNLFFLSYYYLLSLLEKCLLFNVTNIFCTSWIQSFPT